MMKKTRIEKGEEELQELTALIDNVEKMVQAIEVRFPPRSTFPLIGVTAQAGDSNVTAGAVNKQVCVLGRGTAH